MQMRVDPNSTVAGYPVLLVRQALRKLRQIDQWDASTLAVAAGLPAAAGLELAKALAAEGLIRNVQKDAWTVCQDGMTLTAATAGKRLTRSTADRQLAAFMDRVARVNSDPYFLGRVTRVALFGSMLNRDIDRPATSISQLKSCRRSRIGTVIQSGTTSAYKNSWHGATVSVT
jgi:hypothetical protein